MPSRSTFLTFIAAVPTLIGALATLAPATLLALKGAEPSAAAEVMARTTGVLLLTVGLLTFLVRRDPSSPSLRAVLVSNLVLQLALLPIDPAAFAAGTFVGLASFVPNTVLHVLIAVALGHYLREMGREEEPRVVVR